MPKDTEQFETRLSEIRRDLVAQGWRVLGICERAFDVFFTGDLDAAAEVVALDDEVDRVDVQIEKDSVELLGAVARQAIELSEFNLRQLLVIVKANNELERAADCAIAIAGRVEDRAGIDVPETFRVMANSVLGIIRDACGALDKQDPDLAKLVLRSEDAVRGFKATLLREAENDIASGSMSVDCGFLLHEIASQCENAADHATNIAEQVLYAVTGKIVRHVESGWIELDNT